MPGAISKRYLRQAVVDAAGQHVARLFDVLVRSPDDTGGGRFRAGLCIMIAAVELADAEIENLTIPEGDGP